MCIASGAFDRLLLGAHSHFRERRADRRIRRSSDDNRDGVLALLHRAELRRHSLRQSLQEQREARVVVRILELQHHAAMRALWRSHHGFLRARNHEARLHRLLLRRSDEHERMRIGMRAQMVANRHEQLAVLLRRHADEGISSGRAGVVVTREQRARCIANADHWIERRAHADRVHAELERLALLGGKAIANAFARTHDAAHAARIRKEQRRSGRRRNFVGGGRWIFGFDRARRTRCVVAAFACGLTF